MGGGGGGATCKIDVQIWQIIIYVIYLFALTRIKYLSGNFLIVVYFACQNQFFTAKQLFALFYPKKYILWLKSTF